MQPAHKNSGFTIVELLMTMIIIGIIAAVAAPRFFDNDVFQTRGFADQVQASLRYAQKIAIAQHRVVCANYTGPGRLALTITVTASCDTSLNLPTGSANHIDAPSGAAFSMAPASINFDALGRPNVPAVATVGTIAITVEAETGYVHSP